TCRRRGQTSPSIAAPRAECCRSIVPALPSPLPRWDESLRRSRGLFDELRLVLAAAERSELHELDLGPHRQLFSQLVADRVRELVGRLGARGELDAERERRLLLHACGSGAGEGGAADPRR